MAVICFDFDGVLFTQRHDSYELGEPIKPAIDALNKLFDDGHVITIYSGRPTNEIVKALEEHGIKAHRVNDRELIPANFKITPSGKPYYDVFIDDRALNPADTDDIYNTVNSMIKVHESLEFLRRGV